MLLGETENNIDGIKSNDLSYSKGTCNRKTLMHWVYFVRYAYMLLLFIN